MIMVRGTVIALALMAGACSRSEAPAEAPASAEASVPADVAATVSRAAPGITIISGELDGGNEYEVTGRMPDGQEVELDLVQANGAWTVSEIQRDVAWSSVPEPVRAAAMAAPNAFEPVRVIESRQPADGSVVFELFSTANQGGAGGGPALEVRWHEGKAAVLPPAR